MKYLINVLVAIFLISAIARIVTLEISPILAIDHRPLYFGSEMLKNGLNPYDDTLTKVLWGEQKTHNKVGLPYNPLLHPPYTVGIYSLFSFDSWNSAGTFFLYLSILAVLTTALIIACCSRLHWYLALGVFLSLKFIPYLILLAQPTLIAVCGIGFYYLLSQMRKETYAGLFLGLGWLKPTLLLPLLIYLASEHKWRKILFSLWFPILGMAIYLYYLPPELAVDSIYSLLDNLSTIVPIVMSPESYDFGDMTSITKPLILWLGIDYEAITYLPVVILGSGIICYFYMRNKMTKAQKQLYLYLLSWITLYHHAYDVLIIWLAFTFLIEEIKYDVWGFLLMCGIAVFIFPIEVHHTNAYPLTLLVMLLYLCISILRSEKVPRPDI